MLTDDVDTQTLILRVKFASVIITIYFWFLSRTIRSLYFVQQLWGCLCDEISTKFNIKADNLHQVDSVEYAILNQIAVEIELATRANSPKILLTFAMHAIIGL